MTFYKPVKSNEVFRVVGIRLQLNSNFATIPVKWYELDLETAPIKFENVDKLLKNEHYIYDLTTERNVKYEFYKEFVKKMDNLKNLLTELSKYYFAEADLYMYEDNIIVELNELIYFIKSNFDNKYYRLFETIKSPFGYWDNFKFKYNDINNMNFDSTKKFTLINYSTKKCRMYKLTDTNNCRNIIFNQLIDLLNYTKDIGENYLEHGLKRNTE